jgi:hypothetical protein
MISLLLLFQSVVLTGGTVHTMVPGETPKVTSILVEDGRIKSVGGDVEAPKDARKIDCTGMHLVPGLIDGMVNFDSDHDALYLSSGITLVRDVGNDLERSVIEHDLNLRDRNPGPATWISGAVLDGVPPSTTAAVVLASPEEAADKLPRLFEKASIDFVSMYNGLNNATWRKVIELTHKRQLQAWGPLIHGASLSDALDAGQDGLYYLEAFLPRGTTWDKLAPEEWKASVELVAGKKLAITPVLDVFAQRLVAPKDARPPELAYLGPFYIVSWMADLEIRRSVVKDNPDYLRSGLRVVETQGKLLKDLYDHGVTLVPGSASPNPWLFPGKAFVDELELWERAGIPSPAVLRMATVGAAQTIGADRDHGSLAAGKLADIVIVKNDPEADVKNLRDPELVLLRGRVLDRATLESLRADLRARQQKRQEAAFKPLKIKDPELPFGDVLLRGVVETRAFGQRISGENYAVVRRPDKSLVYRGHMFTSGSATTADTDVDISQTIVDDELVEFTIEITSAQHAVSITGHQVGGTMNVERRVDGGFVDNTPRRERLAFVDAGSVTTELILGQRRTTGKFRAMYLEDIDPVIGNYEMHVEPTGMHLLRTPTGDVTMKFDAVGALSESMRQEGRGVLQSRSISTQAVATGGLPIPREKPLAADPLTITPSADSGAPRKK